MPTPVYTSDIIPAQNRTEITSVNDDDLLIVSQDNALKKITKANLQEALGVNEKADSTDVNTALDLKADKTELLALGEVTGTAYDGAKGKANADDIATLQTEKASLDTVPTFNGIKFPSTQVASSDPNTLDDYEEGSFTPVLAINSDSTGIVYNYNEGYYTKIGNVVIFTFAVSIFSKGLNTGVIKVEHLPFSASRKLSSTSINYNFETSYYQGINSTDVYDLGGILLTSDDTSILLRKKDTPTGIFNSTLLDTDITDGFNLRMNGTYITN